MKQDKFNERKSSNKAESRGKRQIDSEPNVEVEKVDENIEDKEPGLKAITKRHVNYEKHIISEENSSKNQRNELPTGNLGQEEMSWLYKLWLKLSKIFEKIQSLQTSQNVAKDEDGLVPRKGISDPNE